MVVDFFSEAERRGGAFFVIEKNLCTGCGVCAAVCGEKAISMRRDKEGFVYPFVDESRCTHCGLCDRKCHVIQEKRAENENDYFGAHAKKESVRLSGSSGGIFPLLAKQVIKDGGIVVGASLRPDGTVRHIAVEQEEDLALITRTKYVQSEIMSVLEDIRRFLKEKRPVLFCGTPCQAEAVRTYIGKNRDSLILVSLICYGVPSPGIWERYVRFLEKKHRGHFRSFLFRDKRGRDNGHTCVLQLKEKDYVYSLDDDLFCRTFFRNINIRPSCFQCRYCTVDRDSDITIGDFWGLEQVRPDWNDGMGNSAVICHTPAGKELWNRVREDTEWFFCREEDVANVQQPRLKRPTEPSPLRGIYMRLYRLLPFSVWIRLFIK